MLRLVETYFASAGKPDVGDRPPPCFLHFRTVNTFFAECRYLGLQIVTHEIEFVPAGLFGEMNRHFCGRQCEDQPFMAGVHGWKSEDVPEEGAISLCVLAGDDYMGAKHHPLLLSLRPPSTDAATRIRKRY